MKISDSPHQKCVVTAIELYKAKYGHSKLGNLINCQNLDTRGRPSTLFYMHTQESSTKLHHKDLLNIFSALICCLMRSISAFQSLC